LIECNRQRKKTPSQIYNEVKLLEKIEKERAEIRQKALAGTRPSINNDLPVNLSEGIKQKGDTRDILAQKVGVPVTKLETILEIGKLAETGKTKEVREAEKRAEEKETGLSIVKKKPDY
jgi:hypothetical protein